MEPWMHTCHNPCMRTCCGLPNVEGVSQALNSSRSGSEHQLLDFGQVTSFLWILESSSMKKEIQAPTFLTCEVPRTQDFYQFMVAVTILSHKSTFPQSVSITLTTFVTVNARCLLHPHDAPWATKWSTRDCLLSDQTLSYPVQSGSHQRSECWHSRTHRHCPRAGERTQLSSLQHNEKKLS